MTPAEITAALVAGILSLHSPDWNGERYAKPSIERHDMRCIAEAVYWEARGEPAVGQLTVAYAVLDRYAYTDGTLCKMVHNPNHFSPRIGEPIKNPVAWDNAIDAAVLAYSGVVERPKVSQQYPTHFHAVWMRPYWADDMHYVGRVSGHKFYREGTR